MVARMHALFSGALAALTLSSAVPVQAAEERIVSVGGDVTEIVYALGFGDQVVATDSTSVFPAEARDTPKVGYARSLAAESVLSLSPTILILGGAAGPEEVVRQLESVGLDMLGFDAGYSIDAVRTKVTEISARLGAEERGAEIVADLESDWAQAQAVISRIDQRPRALFFASMGDGGPRAAGRGTAAHAVMELLGVENAFGDQEGYQALSTEAAVAANPDIIIAMSHNVRAMGGLEAVASDPAIAMTEAGRERRILAVDSVRVMSFGPRVGEGLVDAGRELERMLSASEQPIR